MSFFFLCINVDFPISEFFAPIILKIFKLSVFILFFTPPSLYFILLLNNHKGYFEINH